MLSVVPRVQHSLTFESKYKYFHTRKCIRKYTLQNGGKLISSLVCYYQEENICLIIIHYLAIILWNRDIDKLSALLVLCEAVQQTSKSPEIWGIMAFMWSHSKVCVYTFASIENSQQCFEVTLVLLLRCKRYTSPSYRGEKNRLTSASYRLHIYYAYAIISLYEIRFKVININFV